MSSIVSEFIINPVLRQARRFSEISRSTFVGDDHEASAEGETDTGAVSDLGIVEEPALDGDIDRPQTPHSRPISASTENTRVGEIPDGLVERPASVAVDDEVHDRLGFPLPPRKGRGIPEDDGMRVLRRRIQSINARIIPASEKAKLMHDLLLEGYRSSQVANHGRTFVEQDSLAANGWEPSTSPGPLESLKSWYSHTMDSEGIQNFQLSDSDVQPTYAPVRLRKNSEEQSPSSSPEYPNPLGCQHYERNVKLQCFTCKKWYTCRFCHDAKEGHSLIRRETRNMLCMLCGTPQRASEVCVNCGEVSAHYYCNICKLWENRKSKPIYHCNDCGICRRGLGLGKDFFHCKTCRACITTSIESSHKCIERSTDCDCPICGEYMFTSPKPVVFMKCGHSIHKKCYDQHMKVSYKCPICNKSLANMESQFRNLDVAISGQPMPPEFRDTKATILCNDCSGRSVVPYHWLGLKCSLCLSYNTVELQIHAQGDRGPPESSETDAAREGAARPGFEAQGHSALEPHRASSLAVRTGTWIPNRRRHSSHGIEMQHQPPERIARSLSPLHFPMDPHLMHVAADDDSDDDILGLWRGTRSGEEENEDDEYSESEEESDSYNYSDDDDDEDDILLIGHR